jgi:hypothetical protein
MVMTICHGVTHHSAFNCMDFDGDHFTDLQHLRTHRLCVIQFFDQNDNASKDISFHSGMHTIFVHP